MPGLDFLQEELDALGRAGRRRTLRQTSGAPGAWIELDGRRVLNVSSNDYLGLAADGRLAEAARAALDEGTGSTASRLIVGNRAQHELLESELAAFHGTESARLFNSGFQGNVGLLAALAGPGDLILSDRLNHASLIDGCRLSRARVLIYEHAEADAVAELLRRERAGSRRCFIVTDGVFSMDGDLAPVGALRELADRFDAALVVDEAHAVGVLGGGRGVCAAAGVVPDVLSATLGKAFGAFGAYVAGARALGEFLLNRARSFVFSTALPASVVASARAGLAVASGPDGEWLRARLAQRRDELARGLRELGLLAEAAGGSPIFPLLVGGDREAVECCEKLLERQVFAQAIRPPTVPEGTARLRIALRADLEASDVEHLLAAIAAVFGPLEAGPGR